MVFVLNKNKKPLNPCSNARARKLLKQKKAVIHKKYPFTIRLKEKKELPTNPDYRLKIDYGSRYTGLSILNGNRVVWLGELHHRTSIKKSMDSRRAHRRFRRSKLRYRQPRSLNRKRKSGWLPPTLRSRVSNIESIVKKLQNAVPLTSISYENVKFNTQLMQNPSISKTEYTQGTLHGYEVREYLLETYNRKCVYCGKENVPFEVEHITPKSRGGSNRISNLALSCRSCNRRKGSLTAKEFGYPHIQSKVNPPLRDVAIINATRQAVYNVLNSVGLPVECGTGGRTKMNRVLLELPKTHYYDACCVGESTPNKLIFKTSNVLTIKALGRGTRQRVSLDKYGFPRAYYSRQKRHFGFTSGDMVKAIVPKGKNKGTWYGSVSCRSRGDFNINIKEGRKQGINHRCFKLVQRADGYKYMIEKKKGS